ncbi:MAG: hypothetical protein IJZ80_11280 [Clostridia bacterium]|nr:hypothetical protein [Clostridia bacterium]
MKNFYIEDWLLENGVSPVVVILFVLLGIILPLIIVRLRYAKKRRNVHEKED